MNLNQNDAVVKKETFLKIIWGLTKETFNFKILFKNLIFFLFCLANFLIFIFYMVPFIYIPIRGVELNIEQYAWIISIIGIINIPARIIFGFITDKNIVHPLLMFSLSCFIASLACIIFYFLTTFWTQVVFSLMFGIASGKYSFKSFLIKNVEQFFIRVTFYL